MITLGDDWLDGHALGEFRVFEGWVLEHLVVAGVTTYDEHAGLWAWLLCEVLAAEPVFCRDIAGRGNGNLRVALEEYRRRGLHTYPRSWQAAVLAAKVQEVAAWWSGAEGELEERGAVW